MCTESLNEAERKSNYSKRRNWYLKHNSRDCHEAFHRGNKIIRMDQAIVMFMFKVLLIALPKTTKKKVRFGALEVLGNCTCLAR